MENRSISLESILEAAALRSTSVIGNSYLAGGYLIGSSLLGLIIIIGAFWYHHNNLSLFKRSCSMTFTCQQNSLMSVQLIHNSLLSLLFMDALNLISAIIFGAALVTLSCDVINCVYVENIWFLSRWFGMFIHLLNASISINHLRGLLNVAMVRHVYFMITVLIIIVVPLYLFHPEAALIALAVDMFLFALIVIVRSIASTSSPSTAILKKLIVVVAMCNFLVVFIPTFIVQCLIYSSVFDDELMYYEIIYTYVLVFTNLHLIFDGFLCALMLKLPSGEEQQEQQEQQEQWQQQWQQRQQQWEQQQQQQLGFPNPGYTVSTTVNQ